MSKPHQCSRCMGTGYSWQVVAGQARLMPCDLCRRRDRNEAMQGKPPRPSKNGRKKKR